MSIVIKSKLDTSGVKDGTAALQNGLKGDLGDALKNVETKAASAEKSLKGMLDLGKIQAAAGAFGALKGILEKAGVSALGLSENTTKAVTSTLDLAAQGVAAGAAFGPVGALIGGVTGALLGYVTATKDATEATAELAKAEKQRQEQLKFDAMVLDKAATLSERFAATQKKAALSLNSDEFGLAGKSLTDLTDAYLDANDKIKYFAERAKDAQAIVDGLTGSQDSNAALVEIQENALENYNKQMDEAIRKQQAAQGQIDALTSSTKSNTVAVKEQISELERLGRLAITNAQKTTAENELVARNTALRADATTSYDGYIAQKEKDAALAEKINKLLADATTLPEIALPMPDIQPLELALDTIKLKAREVGDQLKDSLVNVGVGAAQTLFDNIEAGKKPLEGLGKAFADLASEQLKAIGTGLIGQGLQDEFKAASMAISSLGVLSAPAAALALTGAAEISAGLLMGGAGALLGRRGNHGAAANSTGGSESLGAREPEASGPRELAPVKIYLGPENGMAVFSDDRRGLSKYGEFTSNALELSRKAPR